MKRNNLINKTNVGTAIMVVSSIVMVYSSATKSVIGAFYGGCALSFGYGLFVAGCVDGMKFEA